MKNLFFKDSTVEKQQQFKKFLDIKHKFLKYKYKVKSLLKKKDSLYLKSVNFLKTRTLFSRLLKRQFQTYYRFKNRKLWYHRKLKHTFPLLVKNAKSLVFFDSKTSFKYLIFTINFPRTISDFFSSVRLTKRRMFIKFLMFKKLIIFNFLYFFYKAINSSVSFLKKILIMGFENKFSDCPFLLKKLIQILKKKKFKRINDGAFILGSFMYYKMFLKPKLLIKFNKMIERHLVKKKRPVFKQFRYESSIQRYLSNYLIDNKLARKALKRRFDNMKDYKFSNSAVMFKLLRLNVKRWWEKNKKTKKNFKVRSRNKYFGRVNYRKYKVRQSKEMMTEILRRRWIDYIRKKQIRKFMYFGLQSNTSRGILTQPKMIFKSLYNAGNWFSQARQKLSLFKKGRFLSKASHFNYSKFSSVFLKNFFHKNHNTSNKDEFQNFFYFLNAFKRKSLGGTAWRIAKKFYFSKFYLDNVKTLYYTKLSYKKNSLELNRTTVIHYPINGRHYSDPNQYLYSHLSHLERTMLVTNRLFKKHRTNWTKDFFSFSDHLKIFDLVQKKIYYSMKLEQRVQLKSIKKNLAEKLKIKRKNIFKFSKKLNLSKLSLVKKKQALLSCYNHLVFVLKNFVFVSNKVKNLNYFLQYFLKLNYFSVDSKILNLNRVIKRKMKNSSNLFYDFPLTLSSIEVFPKLLKNQNLNKLYITWLKFFFWNFTSFKKNNFPNYISSLNNFQNLNNKLGLASIHRKEKPKEVLFFGKFLKYFNEKINLDIYFNLYSKNCLTERDSLENLIKFFQSFFFHFLTSSTNTKKLLMIELNLKKFRKIKLLNFIKNRFGYNHLFKKILPFNFFFKNFLVSFVWLYFFTNFLIFKIQRIKNNLYFRKQRYSTRSWVKNKKFLFWMEQQLEKSFKFNVKLNYLNVTKAITKYYRGGFNFYFSYTKKIHAHRFFQGWRQQSIYADILWIIIIAVKYYSSSFLSNMISEQIVKKRKKQWPFIKIVRMVIREVLPKTLTEDPEKVNGLRVGINGKINGRDRSINYLIYKYFKDKQRSKIQPIFLKVDYSLSFANSKYGVFGIRVWISRF